jgi:hypothetical protein
MLQLDFMVPAWPRGPIRVRALFGGINENKIAPKQKIDVAMILKNHRENQGFLKRGDDTIATLPFSGREKIVRVFENCRADCVFKRCARM